MLAGSRGPSLALRMTSHQGETVADLVEAQVARTPRATAVVSGQASLAYAELDASASRLAHHLVALGVGPDVTVGVCVERSLNLAVALLAVLKAGGACVPLDPSYPPGRLAFMVDDAEARVIVTHGALAERLPGTAVVLRLNVDAHAWASQPPTAPPRAIDPDRLAYVMYTSGPTGEPRGVMLTHRGLVDHHRNVVDLYGLGVGDRVLQFCPIGVAASIEEMFPSWAAGATVIFPPDDLPVLGRSWLEWLRAQRITVLHLPTSHWHEWAHDLDTLGELVPDDVRLVVVGGEKAVGSAYRTWLLVGGDGARWINAYGTTEVTCVATTYEPPSNEPPDHGDERDPPIGRPLPNVSLWVVDERGEPVPPGATGELLIGGAGVARGYLNQPDLTAERFIADADGAAPGARRYRTGDLARVLPSGDLDFVGRRDDQVKIRGFRVECGEVESVLVRHPAVAEVAVVAREVRPGERRLVAYVVPAGAARPVIRDLRRFLAERLPAYMVPGAFTTMESLPRTPDGMVDRAALG